jgi:hypothetical protein
MLQAFRCYSENTLRIGPLLHDDKMPIALADDGVSHWKDALPVLPATRHQVWADIARSSG